MKEQAVCFGKFNSLVGILTLPRSTETRRAKTAIIFLNAGIVHRVAAGRVYVKLARALARTGFLAFRFDFSGIGDSPARQDSLRFEKSAVAETQNAMDFLSITLGITQFILLGGCSGARVAFDTACCDTRVAGALLINFPCVEEEDGQENPGLTYRGRLSYYRRSALLNPSSWWRLITGHSNYRQLITTMTFAAKRLLVSEQNNSPRAARFRLDLKRLAERQAHLSFICSEGDHCLDDLRVAGGRDLKSLCAENKVAMDIIDDSDHTFSSLQDQDRLIKTVVLRAMTMSQTQDEVHASSTTAGLQAACLPEYQS